MEINGLSTLTSNPYGWEAPEADRGAVCRFTVSLADPGLREDPGSIEAIVTGPLAERCAKHLYVHQQVCHPRPPEQPPRGGRGRRPRAGRDRGR